MEQEILTPEMVNYLIAFIGIFLGVLIRTLLPYMQKLQETPDIAFQWQYVVTAMLSGVGTSIGLILIFDIPTEPVHQIFVTAIAFSYFGEEILNSIMKAKGITTVKHRTTSEVKQLKLNKEKRELEEKIEEIDNDLDSLK